MNNNQKLILAIILIVIAIVAVLIWAYLATIVSFDQIHNVLLQLTFMAIGSWGTYYFGQLVSEREYKLQARERYRRLRTLFNTMLHLAKIFDEVESNPHSGYSENSRETVEKYRRASSEVVSFATSSAMSIRDSLESWNDLASEQVEDMHRELFTESLE